MKYVLLLLLLAGCATDEAAFTTVSGKRVGTRQMEQISVENLSLRFPPEPKIVSAQKQTLQDRVLEDVYFGVGIIRHEILTAGPSFQDQRSVAEFRHLFSDWYLGGTTVQHTKLEPEYDHPFMYAVFRLNKKNCTAFVRPLGSVTAPGEHREAVQGIFCGWSKDFTLKWATGIERRS
jgi:hypothetical protein